MILASIHIQTSLPHFFPPEIEEVENWELLISLFRDKVSYLLCDLE